MAHTKHITLCYKYENNCHILLELDLALDNPIIKSWLFKCVIVISYLGHLELFSLTQTHFDSRVIQIGKTENKNQTTIVHITKPMSLMWMVVVLFLCHLECSSAQCPRQEGAECKGPYVIRPAHQQVENTSHQCHAGQQSAMMSCMQQCQADVCCRAFGLDAAGTCVKSKVKTETLYFVKESPDPVDLSCFQG